MQKTSRFRPNPTWCILRCGLKTIWGIFHSAASDSYFWKKRNDLVSYKTTTTNLNRNNMAYPTLFHAVGTLCLVAVFLPLVCFLLVFSPGNSQFYEEDTLLLIGPCYNVRPLFFLNNVNWKLSLFPFGSTLENTFLLVLPSLARLIWVTPMASLIRRLLNGRPLRTWFYF